MKRNIILLGCLCFFNCVSAETYYQYSHDEIGNLATKKISKLEITDEQMHKWDPVIEELAKKEQVSDEVKQQLKGFLEVAKADAVSLSENKGSLDPLTLKIIGLFFPDVRQPQNYQSDPYSEALAQMIFPKIKKQYETAKVPAS